MPDHVILLAEDDPAWRRLCARALRGAGFTVVVAENGAEALSALDQPPTMGAAPAVLVLDLMMPELDGLAVLRHLAQRRLAIPMVAMSEGEHMLAAAMELGAQAALLKPFAVDALITTVSR